VQFSLWTWMLRWLAPNFSAYGRSPTTTPLLPQRPSFHGLTIVTRNERDFAGLGVAIINPWTA